MTSKLTLLLGDAKRLDLADNSVDLIITHPPYFGIDVERYGGVAAKQINATDNRKKMLKAMAKVMREMERVLKPTGSLILANGTTDQMDMRIILEALEYTSFQLIDRVVQNSYGLDSTYHLKQESVVSDALTTWYHLALTPDIKYNPFLVKRYNNPVWEVPFNNMDDPIDTEMFKTFHVLDVMNREIPKRFIEMFSLPGDTVLDPFGGSALVAVTAVEMGRVGISNDISEEQVQSAKMRARLTLGIK